MGNLPEIVRASGRAMVARLGCLDAAAATINARWGGHTTKATLSKKISGALDFTVADIVALEDALSSYGVTEALARRLADPVSVRGGLMDHGGALARETGEAVSAVMRAASTSCGADRAEAVRELAEAKAVLDRCILLLEAET